MTHLLARLTPHRFINLNHVIDLSFYERKNKNDETYFSVNIRFTDGIREEIHLSDKEFSNFYQEIKNALV